MPYALGGLQYKGSVDASTSLDTLTSIGTYSIQNNHVGSPTGSHYGIMAVYMASSFLVQLVTDMSDSSTFIRACWGGVWKQWQRLDNFGCSTAADLASLLGAFKAMGSIPTNVNWDSTALKSGIYLIENYSWVSGLPDDAVTGILVIFRTNDSSNNFRVALFFTAENTNRKFFYNIYRASWGGWQQA